MAPSKEEEAKGEALPAYEEFASSSTSPIAPPSAPRQPTAASANGPTVTTPFNFPSDSDLPAYSATPETVLQRPVAIPQVSPDPKAPFLDAYSEVLLRHGVTGETWAGFLSTLSGFLAATVSDKAVSHAAQMARHVGQVPKRFGRETLAHARSTGRQIADSARKGNFVGAATHTLLGGIVWLPVATAVRAIGAAVSLPFAAIGAAVEDPKTPKERAEAYAQAANAKWLNRRGLEAHLLETAELAPNLGLSVDEMLAIAKGAKEGSAVAQLGALGTHVAEVEVRGPATLELGAITFWLVVMQKLEDESDRASGKGKGKKNAH
ncbi:hypothetical protein F4781DRAFT_428329 [Annulohypoxylon bovei var. microspora]|nr:hypothetical protein F4781DRAFT_428329 [Annulohypoxylon bovei var. microspora]